MSEQREPARSGGYDVLVVEDNPVNQKVVVGLLTKWGHRVAVAGDGAQALEALARQDFDVVLMDIQMPVMDGIEATCAIRAREREQGGHLPIIAVTAHAALKDRTRCLEAGVDRYLTKPLNSELLRQALAELLPTAASEPIAAAPEAPGGSVDFEQLKACVGDDPELLAEVILVFIEEAHLTLASVGRAIADQRSPDLATSAHRLKGSLATMGAAGAAETARVLEVMGREGEFAGATAVYERLTGQVAATCECLRTWKGQRAA
jgi:two-component system sensor histidine kinase/response regulator